MGHVVSVSRVLLAWEETIKHKLLIETEKVDEMSCVCKACERDVKRHKGAANYQPHWRAKVNKECYKCIAPACNTTYMRILYIHVHCLNWSHHNKHLNPCATIPESTEGQFVSLCQVYHR